MERRAHKRLIRHGIALDDFQRASRSVIKPERLRLSASDSDGFFRRVENIAVRGFCLFDSQPFGNQAKNAAIRFAGPVFILTLPLPERVR